MKIAILYICTGKYDIFWKGFFENFEEKFIYEAEKEYFVFTDAEKIWKEENLKVHKIYQENLGWPGNTLKRFEMFLRMKKELQSFDYIFFFNANARCNTEITAAEMLPQGEKRLTVVQHPGFFDKKNTEFDYDRNENSMAYIPMGEGQYYVCGGINGGYATDYLQLADTLAQNIRDDEAKGIIARWHDESHLNRYIIDRTDVRVLPPSFCFPEGSRCPFEAKIIVLSKMNYINVDRIKKKRGFPNIIMNTKAWFKRVRRMICHKVFHKD